MDALALALLFALALALGVPAMCALFALAGFLRAKAAESRAMARLVSEPPPEDEAVTLPARPPGGAVRVVPYDLAGHNTTASA